MITFHLKLELRLNYLYVAVVVHCKSCLMFNIKPLGVFTLEQMKQGLLMFINNIKVQDHCSTITSLRLAC